MLFAMSLIQCPDCKHQVSSEADKCPNCGRTIKQRQTATGLLAAIIIGLGIGWVIIHFFV